jgi:serine/threonine protein kinase
LFYYLARYYYKFILGTPNDDIWPGFSSLPLSSKLKLKNSESQLNTKFEDFLSESGRDLLSQMLCLDPKKRITTKNLLTHKYFKEKPYPKDVGLM